MNQEPQARGKLLEHGKKLFWDRGYANVSLRQIAGGAGVDVALISRYFGGKFGLFEATLTAGFDEMRFNASTPLELIDIVVGIFVNAPRPEVEPSFVRMILMNAQDPDVGELVRGRYQRAHEEYLARIIGDARKAAMFSAVLFGVSVMEKSLNLTDFPAADTPEFVHDFRYMLEAALMLKN